MDRIAIIGFGEAGQAFAGDTLRAHAAFDIDPAKRGGIAKAATADEALNGATLVLSLVTADQAWAAARDYAPLLGRGALWCDMNSVAPDTKRAAAAAIEAVGARYADVAVMAPVHPARCTVPLLVSAQGDAVARLIAAGFSNVRDVGDEVGRASAIKMIRSVMVKGIEALTAEMMLAADTANVADEVLASLGDDWTSKAAYNLERMTTHGARRAAEMEQSCRTLEALGVQPVMTRGTVMRQRAMAESGLRPDSPTQPAGQSDTRIVA